MIVTKFLRSCCPPVTVDGIHRRTPVAEAPIRQDPAARALDSAREQRPARSDNRLISASIERPRAPGHEDAIICPQFHRLWRHMLEIRGGFRVLGQQSESADNRSNTAGQSGAIVNQAVRPSSAGERDGVETPNPRAR